MGLNILPITKRKGVAIILILSLLFFSVTVVFQKTPLPSFQFTEVNFSKALLSNFQFTEVNISEHRTKTSLIFNNENLCAANPLVLVHNHNYSTASLYATEINQRSIVIVVLSARKNFMKRKLIRQTYGSIKSVNDINILAVVFMLGSLNAPDQEKVDYRELEAENIQFGDLIMGDFVDSYRNLTRKTIMAYEWLTSFCREAQIVVKTDDDVLVNIYKLTEELSKWSPTEVTSSKIWGRIHWHEGVVKDAHSVFYASPEDFPDGVFPEHCVGVGYVTPMNVIDRIVKEISTSFLGRVCTHEDVFMTAIVPQKINSNLNLNRSREIDSIKLVNAPVDWCTYALENEKGDEAELLLKLIEQQSSQTGIIVDELQKKFEPKIFYLLTHNKQFEKRYNTLWQIIQNKYENKTGGT